MSRDDDSTGWSGADKSPLVVVQPRQAGGAAAGATRAAGSLILIFFMLASVVLAALSVTMHHLYEAELVKEIYGDHPPNLARDVLLDPRKRCERQTPNMERSRQIVVYRECLDESRRLSPIRVLPALAEGHPQAELDVLRADNATLRKDNQARIDAARRLQNAREPRCSGLPGVPNNNCRR